MVEPISSWSDAELIDVPMLCHLLKVKPSWVYDMVESDRLLAVRPGGGRGLKFSLVDVAAFVDAGRAA